MKDELGKRASNPEGIREKVALFRKLFRGREDVFAKRWENPKKGTSGYALACDNEWLRGICNKPRIKCSDCPNQAFPSVTDQVLVDHLLGRYVVGIYPLLKDETCWFLAVDFDKGSWQDDVSAFLQTCRGLELPAAVERSRSGNGGHVWIFFEAPVSATAARNMGCHLITETMKSRPELPMQSYDRLFPNQNTMPRGGFGNLIALPFQHKPRQNGNTLFVDDQWVAYDDQWAFLAGIQRMRRDNVESLARQALETEGVIGLSRPEPTDRISADDLTIFSAARSTGRLPVVGPLPKEVQVEVSTSLFIERAGLPPGLLNEIKRLAAFQNPEFYQKQALRLSTALTPRVISCSEDLPDHVVLPRGCLADLEQLLDSLGVEVVLKDARTDGDKIDLEFHGDLTEIQSQAAASLLKEDIGVFVAPPGCGKTVVGIHTLASRARNTLIIVHRTQLLDQWINQLSVFLDLDSKELGQIGSGKRRPTGFIDVAMLQSLTRKGEVDEIVADYGHIIVDECHHIPAFSFERVMRTARARFITGLTATPQRKDGHHPIIQYQMGPVRFRMDPRLEAARRPFSHNLIMRETDFRLAGDLNDTGIQEIYRQLSEDENRNNLILDDVIGSLEAGRHPLLLTERRDHLDFLAEKLDGFTKNLIVLKGGMRNKERRANIDWLTGLSDDEERLVLATGRFIGEGFDNARLDTLFLALPIAWKGTLVQYAGRIHRRHGGKSDVQIVDYVDRQVPVLARMFEKRLKGYRAMGYTLVEA